MADSKITALPAMTTPEDADLLPVVNDPAGTPATQKITWLNAWLFFKGKADALYAAITSVGSHTDVDLGGILVGETLVWNTDDGTFYPGAPAPASHTHSISDLTDLNVSGQSWKEAVYCATPGTNINLSSAPSTIDGVTPPNGEFVLVKDQTSELENGIYEYNGSTVAMTRASNALTFASLEGAEANVKRGSTLAKTKWKQTEVGGTIDTDDVIWEEQAAAKTELDAAVADAIAAQFLTVQAVSANDVIDATYINTHNVVGTSGGAITFTFNTGHGWPAGAFAKFRRNGANDVIFADGTATLIAAGTRLTIGEDAGEAVVTHEGSDVFVLSGNLEA